MIVMIDELLEQSGLTHAVFENELKEQLRIKKLLNIPEPTDEQVKAYYEENMDYFEVPETVKASHILIKVEDSDSEDIITSKKEKAQLIRQKLIEGADFAELASENSDCPSKQQGGSLGDVRRGQMVRPFEEAAFELEAGETHQQPAAQRPRRVVLTADTQGGPCHDAQPPCNEASACTLAVPPSRM